MRDAVTFEAAMVTTLTEQLETDARSAELHEQFQAAVLDFHEKHLLCWDDDQMGEVN